MDSPKFANTGRTTSSEKNANSKKWYKDQIDKLDSEDSNAFSGVSDNNASEYKRKKANYDLYNNILDLSDFEYVTKPFGDEELGELPADMVNRDISSSRIKALLGLEMKRPFTWKAIATNKEATTRREKEKFKRIQDFVLGEIMTPIQQQIEMQYQEEMKGSALTPEQERSIQDQIASEVKSNTPEEVLKYMQRDHQDPAEVLATQILEYLSKELGLRKKFNDGWKHGVLSAEEIYWVGIINNRPELKAVNPLRFNYDNNPDMDYIEDGDWATYEFRMTPQEAILNFGEELSNTQIDRIIDQANRYSETIIKDQLFNFDSRDTEYQENTVRVLHCVWKALRKIGFLTYEDEFGEIQVQLVNEQYRINKDNGDIAIDWQWIPEVYEGYKINKDIYVSMNPVAGQYKDLNNLHKCKLPYKGVVYDDTNSKPTSLMDRMKPYQYYYNIVMYRLELLLASDKGKKVMMNINAIPKNSGIDLKKFQYFFESSPFGYFDMSEEGAGYGDANTVAKMIDLSTASDIQKYIQLAEFLDQKCGRSVGITDATLGEISPSQEVGNTRQAIVQTSHILEPYYDMHTIVKKNVLQALIETAKVAYSSNPPESLVYTLDDMSLQTLKMDTSLLDNSTYGIFISDGSVDAEAKENLRQFAHAALQNQSAELSDVIAIVRQKDSQQAEEILKVAETKRIEREEANAANERAHQKEMSELASQEAERQHEREKELIILKEQEDRETELQKQAILSMGFNEDKDLDKDGMPDVLEVAKHGVDAEIKMRKQDLEEKKFEQQKKEHDDKQKMEKMKMNSK